MIFVINSQKFNLVFCLFVFCALTDSNCNVNSWRWNRSRDLHCSNEDIWSSKGMYLLFYSSEIQLRLQVTTSALSDYYVFNPFCALLSVLEEYSAHLCKYLPTTYIVQLYLKSQWIQNWKFFRFWLMEYCRIYFKWFIHLSLFF